MSAIPNTGIAIPKVGNLRIPKLLALARESTCMLTTRVKHQHNQDTVIAAHSDSSKHGKGTGIKAHDVFIAYICHNCHAMLPRLKREEREELFAHAMTSTRNYLWAMGWISGCNVRDMTNDASWLDGWRVGRIQVQK